MTVLGDPVKGSLDPYRSLIPQVENLCSTRWWPWLSAEHVVASAKANGLERRGSKAVIIKGREEHSVQK